MKKIEIIVSGKVQGVGFRMSTLQKARQIGVNGYVRNLTNGDVKIVAFGETEKVDTLKKWAEFGPPSSVVNNLEVNVIADDGEQFEGFEIRR